MTRPAAGVPSDNTSLVAVLAGYQAEGYDADFHVADDGQLCCRVCGVCTSPSHVDVVDLRRLEGASDPADMLAVLAVRCPACSAKGTGVVQYGPDAEAGHSTLLRQIDARR